MPEYTINQGLKAVADKIIAIHRPHLMLLKIEYMFRPEAAISDGKAKSGMCIRLDDRNWTIHKTDFIIEIAQDIWDDPNTTDEFREALMDHELGHVGIVWEAPNTPKMDPSGRIKTRCKMHDIEEFEEVLERHGAYHKGLRDFLDAFAASKTAKKKAKSESEEPIEV